MNDRKKLLTGDMIASKAPTPVPAKEKTEVMNFRVPPSFRHQMRQMALDKRMNLSQLLMASVTAFGKGAAS